MQCLIYTRIYLKIRFEDSVLDRIYFITIDSYFILLPLYKAEISFSHNIFEFQALFGREADKLEHSNDDENTYYLMEKEPLVNKFISVPRDKASLNCAVFIAGIVEAILTGTGFVSIFIILLVLIQRRSEHNHNFFAVLVLMVTTASVYEVFCTQNNHLIC